MVAGLEAAFREAVDDYIETCAKIGKNPEKPVFGQPDAAGRPGGSRQGGAAAELGGQEASTSGGGGLAAAAKRAG